MIKITLEERDFDPEVIVPEHCYKCIIGHNLNMPNEELFEICSPGLVINSDTGDCMSLEPRDLAESIISELDNFSEAWRKQSNRRISECGTYKDFMNEMKEKYLGTTLYLVTKEEEPWQEAE